MGRKTKTGFYISDIPEYNGSGVYALIDEDGKIYIGSSIHIRDRINSHLNFLRMAIIHNGFPFENIMLQNAAINGKKFRCEILCKTDGIDRKKLRLLEKDYLEKYGGTENTYNNITPSYHPVDYVSDTKKEGA